MSASPSTPNAPASRTEQAEEVERRLALANQQLARFAEDLKQIVNAERERARDLAAANARLAVLDRLKTDFLNFIAHELRTPLTELSAVELIDLRADPASQEKIVQMMREAYERLTGFVGRGLEYFNWIGGAQPAVTVVDLGAHVTATAAEFAIVASVPAAPCRVQASATGIGAMLSVLFDNARKFTPTAPDLRVELTAPEGSAIVVVRDNGLGFPSEMADEIFAPFTIADTLHHARGTGLSLPLARAIAETYGGSLRAESAGPGCGATFTVTLPLCGGTT